MCLSWRKPLKPCKANYTLSKWIRGVYRIPTVRIWLSLTNCIFIIVIYLLYCLVCSYTIILKRRENADRSCFASIGSADGLYLYDKYPSKAWQLLFCFLFFRCCFIPLWSSLINLWISPVALKWSKRFLWALQSCPSLSTTNAAGPFFREAKYIAEHCSLCLQECDMSLLSIFKFCLLPITKYSKMSYF